MIGKQYFDKSIYELGKVYVLGLLMLVLMLCGFFTSCNANGISQGAEKPNILFILIDDMGLMDLSLYGETNWQTPNIDKLAREGLYFTRAYTAGSVCTPTRASLVSGKYPAVIGLSQNIRYDKSEEARDASPRYHVSKMDVPLTEVITAEAMKQHGYATAFVGKWHLGDKAYYPTAQGFDINIGGNKLGGPRSYFSPYKIENLTDGPKGEYLTERLTSDTIDLMKKYKQEKKPFFIYLSYYTVHSPIVVANQKTYAKLRQNQHLINPKYASMVVEMDRNIGRLMKALKKMKLEKDTVLFFYSDNGGSMVAYQEYKRAAQRRLGIPPPTKDYKSPYRGYKGDLYEGGIKAPFIVRYPRMIKPGSVSGELMNTPDIYPTLIHLASGQADKLPEGHFTDGVSLVPIFKDANTKLSERDLLWYYPHRGLKNFGERAIIRGDYKLIERVKGDESIIRQLYDLKKDVGERTNLVDVMPEKVKEFSLAISNWEKINGLSPLFEKGYPIYPVKR